MNILSLPHLSSNVRFAYITLMKNMIGLSTDQTYSLFETLFQVSSGSEAFYDVMKQFDDYGKKIYREVLYLKSHFLSKKTENQDDNNGLEDDDDVDEVLQGKSKKINSGDTSITAGSKLVVFDLQRKILQVIVNQSSKC